MTQKILAPVDDTYDFGIILNQAIDETIVPHDQFANRLVSYFGYHPAEARMVAEAIGGGDESPNDS